MTKLREGGERGDDPVTETIRQQLQKIASNICGLGAWDHRDDYDCICSACFAAAEAAYALGVTAERERCSAISDKLEQILEESQGESGVSGRPKVTL